MTTITSIAQGRSIWRSSSWYWFALVLAAATLTFVAMYAGSAWADASFYRPDSGQLAGQPGTIIRSEPMPFPPPGATAYRILYRSTGLHGEPTAVSGVLVVPTSGDNSERPIVAWAHPTSGVVPVCAPSLSRSALREIQGLNEMLADGFAVVATDYPGLGTLGPHPYLIGDSEGKAVLDSVRAARDFLAQRREARFAVWGHSQGGQAALYTGILAHSYAPELTLVGIAAAAPATDLSTLMRDDYATSGGKGLTALALWSWSKLYDIPTGNLVEPSAVPAMDRLATGCIETIFDLLERRYEERPLEKTFLSDNDISEVNPWKSILIDNSPGLTPRDIPVLIAQGTTDDIVRPSVTIDYAKRLCSNDTIVDLLMLPAIGHGFVAHNAAQQAVAWISNRFDGSKAPDDCDAIMSDHSLLEDARSPLRQ